MNKQEKIFVSLSGAGVFLLLATATFATNGIQFFAEKVGIGVENPQESLEVNGNVKISGKILSDGDICIGNCEEQKTESSSDNANAPLSSVQEATSSVETESTTSESETLEKTTPKPTETTIPENTENVDSEASIEPISTPKTSSETTPEPTPSSTSTENTASETPQTSETPAE